MKEANKRKLLEIASYVLDFEVTLKIVSIQSFASGWANKQNITINTDGILLNAFNWDKGCVESYEDVGIEGFKTLAHEVRHVMQNKWNACLPQCGDYFDANGKVIQELYEKDKGEEDANNYAERNIEWLKIRNPKMIKVFGRYIVWFNNHSI